MGASIKVFVEPGIFLVGASVVVTERACPIDALAHEQPAAGVGVGVGEAHRLQVELVLASEREHERLDRTLLPPGRQAEVDARPAQQRAREMLGDRAFEEVADGAGAGRAIAGPADRVAIGPEVLRIRVDRDAHADVVRDTAEYRIVVEPVQVLQDQPALEHSWIFEILEPGD